MAALNINRMCGVSRKMAPMTILIVGSGVLINNVGLHLFSPPLVCEGRENESKGTRRERIKVSSSSVNISHNLTSISLVRA